MAELTQQQIFALGTLIHQKDNARVVWDGARWIGVCRLGHVTVAAHDLLPFCIETPDAGRNGSCGEPFIRLPDQDALLATFRLGGYPALVEACKHMIGSSSAAG